MEYPVVKSKLIKDSDPESQLKILSAQITIVAV